MYMNRSRSSWRFQTLPDSVTSHCGPLRQPSLAVRRHRVARRSGAHRRRIAGHPVAVPVLEHWWDCVRSTGSQAEPPRTPDRHTSGRPAWAGVATLEPVIPDGSARAFHDACTDLRAVRSDLEQQRAFRRDELEQLAGTLSESSSSANESQRQVILDLQSAATTALADIDAALQRISVGTYGHCQQCDMGHPGRTPRRTSDGGSLHDVPIRCRRSDPTEGGSSQRSPMCTSTIAHRPRPAPGPPATQVAGDRQPQRRHLGGLRAWALDGSEPEDQTCRSSFTGIRVARSWNCYLGPSSALGRPTRLQGRHALAVSRTGRVRLSSTISGKGPRTKSCNATSGIATTHHASERTPMTDTVHHPTPALSHLRKKLPSCALGGFGGSRADKCLARAHSIEEPGTWSPPPLLMPSNAPTAFGDTSGWQSTRVQAPSRSGSRSGSPQRWQLVESTRTPRLGGKYSTPKTADRQTTL